MAFRLGLEVTEEEMESAIALIQQLDPPGVGARSLQECLLIQIRGKQSKPSVDTALLILEKYFDEFTKNITTKSLPVLTSRKIY